MSIEEEIKYYLDNITLHHNLDQLYVSCNENHEKESIRKSNVINDFLEKYDRTFINFDSTYEKVCNNLLNNWKNIKRKEFYYMLLLESDIDDIGDIEL